MEVCCICKKAYQTVWTAPDGLWKQLNGGNEGGLMCIHCFDKLARQSGLNLFWECGVERFPVYPDGDGEDPPR